MTVNRLALLFIWLICPCIAHAATKPNIILIMADYIGYECFGCYGSEQYSTPNIDRLAANGIRFTHCYSQPLCTPSRVKLMTGLSNARNYVAFSILKPGERTFAHYLKQAGYKTAVVGKWQLLGAEQYPERFRQRGVWPADAGFDRCCLWQVDKLGERYWNPLLFIDGENRQFTKQDYGPDIVSNYLLDFITENREGPFFAYYPMILVHNPFEPTPDHPNRKKKDRQKVFEDMVAYMDKIVGRIVQKVEELGIAENTLILFIGDNGTNKAITSRLGDRMIQGGKGNTTDAGNRVAFVGQWPGTIPAGQVCNDLVDFSDFLPTFLEVAGVTTSTKFDGRSFLPQLKGEQGNPREWIYEFYCPRPERNQPVRFVRDQRWKLYSDNKLFDVANDPLEKEPISDDNTKSEVVAARSKLQRALEQVPLEGASLLKW